VLCTQIVATLIAVSGTLSLMTPIGWKWALLVCGYALVWFLIKDRMKLYTYCTFDPEEPPLLRHRVRIVELGSCCALRVE
jgi:H+-transporting ATPase